ncbi:MAG: zinc-binding dehydrogenase [Caldilineaceae bacterium]|nr:zinc-binding dehydrogenase [Caldilineaceae bacterium]MCB0124401.1 zinc-binding dehydrogenase [Caldilineaceae bacterium]
MKIKQVVVTGQNQVALQDDLLEDRPLADDEVLIATEATFISAGTELANYTGREPKVFQPGQWCTYPWKSGYANVGVVQAVGRAVTRVKPGERVFSYGNHASAVRYNQRRLVIPVPPELDPVVAAAARMAGVAMTSIIVSEIRDNPWVAVFGLGTVGNLAAQMFAIRGCRVIGVDPVAYRRDLAQHCGIEQTVGGDPASAHDAIMAITGGKGAHITVDAVGHSAVVMQAAQATASFGQLIILGSPRVPVEGNLTTLLSDVHLRWITLRGALEWCVPMYPDVGNRTSQWSKQETIFEWLRRGRLHLEPLISHRLPPQEIKRGYEGLLHQPEAYTGVALVWP